MAVNLQDLEFMAAKYMFSSPTGATNPTLTNFWRSFIIATFFESAVVSVNS